MELSGGRGVCCAFDRWWRGDVLIAVVKMGEDYGVSHILVWRVLNV